MHLLTIAEMPSHKHDLVSPFSSLDDDGGFIVSGGGHGGVLNSPYTNYAGGDQAHENRPPYYALCFIMKI